MNIVLHVVFSILEWVVFCYFALATLYIALFAFAGLRTVKNRVGTSELFQRIAVFIPGYKEDAVILETATEALHQNYPQASYTVFIIADSFQEVTLEQLRQLPIEVIVVAFDKSTKAKALNKAMSQINQPFDIALILDADNIMAPDFLTQINNTCSIHNPVVQAHRIAKNTNTQFALLDAVSEEINNHIFRKGHRALGLSAALIGSGMAFQYDFFKRIMAEVTAVGGFDKELEIRLLKDRFLIDYLHDAIVYDEKVQKADVFARQRRRWLSAQFIYFGRYFFTSVKELVLKANWDLFDKIYQMILPPRVLHLGITTSVFVFYLLLHLVYTEHTWLTVNVYFWGGVWTLTIIALAIAIPKKFYNRETFKAIRSLPRVFLIMFFSLFKLKGANRSFIHTAHGSK